MAKNNYNLNYRTAEKMTKCICPRCGNKHEIMILWIGKGTPRKFCKACLAFRTKQAALHPVRIW